METYTIIWDHITFGKDLITVYDKEFKNYKSFSKSGVFISFNKIKKSYFERLFPNTLTFVFDNDSKLIKDKSSGLVSLEKCIEFAKDHYYYSQQKLQFKKGNYGAIIYSYPTLTNNELFEIYKDKIEKDPYLKFLSKKQSKKHRLIAIEEFVNIGFQESFLFTLSTRSDQYLIVWENSNTLKAAYFFLMHPNNLKEFLLQLEIFICNPEQVKRKHIANKNNYEIFNERMGFIGRFIHKNIHDFEDKIFKLHRLY